MRLKLNYGIRENRDWESLKKYKLVFVPSAEIMSQSDQEAIVDLVKSGASVIMCGVMPRYDENFKDCKILSNHFRIKTTADYHIGNVAYKNSSFPTHIYGSIRSTDDSKVKKLAKEGAKLVGVCSTRLKGHFYFFTFDLASGGNHQRLAFVESILEGEKMSSYLYCSDPSVDVSFQMGEKNGLLLVVAPPPGELSDGYEAASKQVIVKADLRQAGFKSPKVRLTNLFEGEEAQTVRTTLKELKDGIALDVKFPDGIIYLVSKRP
jgi:hypothetical protein